jgi:hypothetical protein
MKTEVRILAFDLGFFEITAPIPRNYIVAAFIDDCNSNRAWKEMKAARSGGVKKKVDGVMGSGQ